LTVELNPSVLAAHMLPIPARLWHSFACLIRRTPETERTCRHDLTDLERNGIILLWYLGTKTSWCDTIAWNATYLRLAGGEM
jgi:hypothetical protein